jgi:hypothetical protein
VLVLSAAKASSYRPGAHEVAISIRGKSEAEAQLSPKFEDVLRLVFEDAGPFASYATTGENNPESISSEQAGEVADFVLQHRTSAALVVHCAAGVCRLEHELALRPQLDADWAARPVELVWRDVRQMLVLEDHGGEPLERLLGRPLGVATFLHIAIPLAAALGRLHARGLIHKDVKPANILVNAATDGVWLTGFGIASRLPREHQPPAPPEVIAGTLAYMAPEQTGRMNRSVDSRSDLYALGVTWYEMLTGALPFTASDPVEWVHCHIARQPVAPSERVTTVPAQLSAIVLKLLAKTAEDRYQTADVGVRDVIESRYDPLYREGNTVAWQRCSRTRSTPRLATPAPSHAARRESPPFPGTASSRCTRTV